MLMTLHSKQQVKLSSAIMGFLGVGKPIGFAAAKAKGINAEVKRRGITQFISHFRRCLPMTRRPLLFGDEIEYLPLKSRAAFWFCALNCLQVPHRALRRGDGRCAVGPPPPHFLYQNRAAPMQL